MKPIQKASSLRQQVLEHLREALLNGAFEFGERITEEKVAELLGVSRTPVREALAVMRQQGILQTREKGGYLIAVPSLEETLEIIEVRRLLEPHAIRRVAEVCTPEDVERLASIVNQEEEVRDKANPREFALRNFKFRRDLFDLMDNNRLKRIFSEFNDHIYIIAMLTLGDVQVRNTVMNGQRAIINALAKHDASAAEKAISAHLNNAEKAYLDAMAGD